MERDRSGVEDGCVLFGVLAQWADYNCGHLPPRVDPALSDALPDSGHHCGAGHHEWTCLLDPGQLPHEAVEHHAEHIPEGTAIGGDGEWQRCSAAGGTPALIMSPRVKKQTD